MKKYDRANMINSLTLSIKESIKEYEQVKKPSPVYDIHTTDSKSSIIERCKVARRELLVLMKEMEL